MTTETDHAALAEALQMLAGTDIGEQVFIVPTIPSQSWHLDVVELDEGDGPRFAVYAEYGGELPFEQRGLRLPEGSSIDADEGSNVTVTFSELTATEAATLFTEWASMLSDGTAFTWSTTWE